MAAFDTIITGGTVVNTCATFKADVGIRNGKIAALGNDLVNTQKSSAQNTIDASGNYVMPGGIGDRSDDSG